MTNKPSERRQKIVDFVMEYQRKNGGSAPSYAEIAEGIGTSVGGGVEWWMGKLKQEGRIVTLSRKRWYMRPEGSLLNEDTQV